MLRIALLRWLPCIILAGSVLEAMAQNHLKPRVIVLTDISSLSAGQGEPDDGQSLIRLMLYTNDLDVEGLIATSNLGHGQRTRPDLIRQVVAAYGKVRPNLLVHNKDYPPPEKLLSVIKEGQPIAGPSLQFDESVGKGKDTEASDWIIDVADKKDARPVWILVWGGSADLAQALWKVRASRPPDSVDRFVSKLRVHAVYDQDQTASWIKSSFPDLFYIFRHHGIRGMYRGGDTTLVRSRWVDENIISDHGPLGALYVNYRGGDIWSGRLGRVYGIKEGDTPSFLYLLNNGLNSPQHPEWGSWAGRFQREDNDRRLWVEAVDSVLSYDTDDDARMAALYRWRVDWQADFAARLDWCVSNFEQANHPPVLEGATTVRLTVNAGEKVRLSAPRSADPDNHRVQCTWFFYPEEGTYHGIFPLLSSRGNNAFFTAPRTDSAQTIHIILKATDDGEPNLSTYRRYIVTLKPKAY